MPVSFTYISGQINRNLIRWEVRIRMPQPQAGARAVDRALDVLSSFRDDEPLLSASDIARRTRLPVSTAHRLARTLLAAGFLELDEETVRYRLGSAVIELGLLAYNERGLPRVVPELGHLSRVTRATADLAIRRGDHAVIVARGSSRPEYVVGMRRPLHSTALGKVLLAWERPGAAEIAGLGPLRPLTSRTIIDPRRLAAELADVRKLGYAMNDGESAVGVRSVAVPILDRAGRVRFALAVRATPEVITEARIPWMLAQARSCAAALQVHLLFPDDRPRLAATQP
jgi:DNA-binding IclR family transcriptional regulator